MQITIVQTEIEQAIRDYVGSKLRIADGMEMTIDLSATRGAEGFKATIDIHPIGEETKAPAKVATPVSKPAIFTPRTITAPAPEPEATQGAEDPPFDGGTAQADEEAKTAGNGEEPQPKEVKQTSEGDGESKTDAPATQAGGRSLFKGLQKPKNN